MGIYIKGMEMPKRCHDCEMSALVDVSDGLTYGCQALKEMISNDRERLPNCPLIEVPPHGRLIDADAFVNKHFTNNYIVSAMTASKNELSTALLNIPLVMNNAPTVIPADPAEEGET